MSNSRGEIMYLTDVSTIISVGSTDSTYAKSSNSPLDT